MLGVGRTQLTDEQFRERMHEGAAKSKDARDYTEDGLEEFASGCITWSATRIESDFYPRPEEEDRGDAGATAPARTCCSMFRRLLRWHRLSWKVWATRAWPRTAKGWTRIVLEKPFGHDLQSAQELNEIVSRVFEEDSVYRIDHYLGKETVQNIIMFRFGNSMFEPIWNRNYIDYVEITAAETLGVENRAAFYEETGALRDMVANHLLQLLTLTAMEPPVAFDAHSVREQKVQVLRAIRPMTVEEVAKRTIRGQYGPGKVNGTDVVGLSAGTGREAQIR